MDDNMDNNMEDNITYTVCTIRYMDDNMDNNIALWMITWTIT